MAKDLLDFSKFKKIFEDDKNTHLKHPKGHTIIVAHVALSPKLKKQIADLPMHPEKMMELAQDIMEQLPHKMAEGGEAKPFKGYNPEKHSRTGGLNDAYREKYNREHGSDLKRPVTGNPKPGSEAAGRKKSFCARMKGVKGPTSEGGELTPKGAALKRWNCHAHGGKIEDDHDEECMHYAEGGNVEKPAVSRINMNYKDVTKRIPQLTEAANKLAGGKLSASEYDALVNKHKPVEAYGFVPQPASREDAMRALNESKRKMYGKTSEIEPGEQTDLRLDIPAYKDHGVWVNSIHRKDAPTVYGSVSSVKNAQMVPSSEKALRVAAGGPKAPFAVIRGDWHPMEEQEAVEKAQKYLKHKDWKQVGYDPERHGYFYDRETMQPIEGAEQVIQIGPLVLAKKPKYGKKEEQLFAEGGDVEMYAKGGRTSALLDEKGRKINKRSERERIFGDDANAPRLSDERMRMMQMLRDKVKQEYGVGLRTAAGKRTETGAIRDKGVQPAFDVYTPEGREAERRYVAEQKALNPKFKRIDPKPDWNNPDKFMDTQPSPDAGIHEVAHARQIPLGMTLAEHQDAMDALQGQVQKDYGFLQNKRTSHEIQPMAMENPIRRELGFPANKSTADMMTPEELAEHNAGRVSRGQPPLETNEEGITLTHDTKEPMYVAGLDHKGNVVYYMRQSRLMNPENRQRTEDIRQKTVKYHPERGMVESMSPDALINLRGQGRMSEAERRLRTRGEERFAEGGQVQHANKSEEGFKRNAREFEKGFNAGEDIGQSFQNIKSALGFAEGGQVGFDAIKKERYYNGGTIRHYADGEDFIEPLTEEEQQYAPQDFGIDFTQPTRTPASEMQPSIAPVATPMPTEPDFAKMAAEQPPMNPWEQKYKEYREKAETAIPFASTGLKPGMTPSQLDEWALNKTLQDKQAAEQQQKRAQMQQTRMDTYQQQLEKNNQAKMQALGIQTPSRGVAGEPTVGGGPATVGEAQKAAPDLMGGGGPQFMPKPTAETAMDLYGPGSPYMEGAREQIAGIYAQAAAEGKIAKERVKQYNQSVEDQNKVLDDLRIMTENSMAENNRIADEYMNERIDPMAVWNDKSVPGKISSAIGLILGGIGGGLTKQENPALKFLQFQIDKSVEGQKMRLGRYPTLLQNNLNQTNNMRLALETTRAQIAEITAKQIEKAAAMYGDELAQAKAQQAAGALRHSMVAGPMMKSNVMSMAVDPSMTGSKVMHLVNQVTGIMPEVANDIRERYVGIVDAVADQRMPPKEIDIVNGITNFENASRRLMAVKKKHPFTLIANLPTDAKKEIISSVEALKIDLAKAHGADPSQATLEELNKQVGKPMSFYETFILNEPRLNAVLTDLRDRKKTALKTGFRADRVEGLMNKTALPSGEASAPREIEQAKETRGFTPLKRR